MDCRQVAPLSLVMALIAPAVGSHGQDVLAKVGYTVQEHALGPVPAKEAIRKEVVTRDGQNVVWLIAKQGGECVVLNGRADPVVSAVKSAPVVSPDGSRVAYKIDVEAGAKRAVVVDGKPGPVLDQANNDTLQFSYDSKRFTYSGDRNGGTALMLDRQVVAEGANVKSGAVFSPDFSRTAYKIGLDNERRAVYVDNKTGPGFLQIDNSSMQFSTDGKRFVYVASEGEGSSAKARVVLDGNPGKAFERVNALTFSPDSRHFAYIAAVANKERVVFDGKSGPEYDAIDPYFLRITPSGQLGYRAVRGDRMFFTLDGNVQCESPGILDWSVGPKGKGIAVLTRTGNSWTVTFNSVKGPDYTALSTPVAISPDGAHVAYTAKKGGRSFVVKDGVESGAWEIVSQAPVFSSDGSHWGYVARREGKWYVVVDGRERGPYDWFAWGGLQFSPDGRHTMFLVQKQAKWIVMLDGKTLVECDAVATTPARFSPDGGHFACMVRQGAQWRVVLDGEPGPLFDRLFDVTPAFAPDDSLEYPAIRENILYRVTHTPRPQQ